MALLHKAVAGCLLVALCSFAAGQAFPPEESVHKPPAGCHEHGQKAPSSAPVTYQCCATGHNAAVLQQALDLGALMPVSRVPEATSQPSTGISPGSLPQLFSADSPPDLTPLRI
ncbi:MAG: hypothetical protein LAO09_15340 [Acidobacteriia bacterium]|nr:hypothetical protein [Terriglobia bacterium]